MFESDLFACDSAVLLLMCGVYQIGEYARIWRHTDSAANQNSNLKIAPILVASTVWPVQM